MSGLNSREDCKLDVSQDAANDEPEPEICGVRKMASSDGICGNRLPCPKHDEPEGSDED